MVSSAAPGLSQGHEAAPQALGVTPAADSNQPSGTKLPKNPFLGAGTAARRRQCPGWSMHRHAWTLYSCRKEQFPPAATTKAAPLCTSRIPLRRSRPSPGPLGWGSWSGLGQKPPAAGWGLLY